MYNHLHIADFSKDVSVKIHVHQLFPNFSHIFFLSSPSELIEIIPTPQITSYDKPGSFLSVLPTLDGLVITPINVSSHSTLENNISPIPSYNRTPYHYFLLTKNPVLYTNTLCISTHPLTQLSRKKQVFNLFGTSSPSLNQLGQIIPPLLDVQIREVDRHQLALELLTRFAYFTLPSPFFLYPFVKKNFFLLFQPTPNPNA